jgi:hypothetical protein
MKQPRVKLLPVCWADTVGGVITMNANTVANKIMASKNFLFGLTGLTSKKSFPIMSYSGAQNRAW